MNKNSIPLTLEEISEAMHKRVAVISSEFTNGFEFINKYTRSVTFFGSARTPESDFYYEKARELAFRVAKELGYAVITGGGPGIMEGANRGANEAGGESLGLNIKLPHEQRTNPYITKSISFNYFFSRKVCLVFSAEAYIFFPGGFGTLDEFTEILTLIQTGKIPKAPIILFGKEHWQKYDVLFREMMFEKDFIEKEDLDLYLISDDLDEIIEIIKNAPIRLGFANYKK